MSGLFLGLAPGEKFIVNGALLENGDKPGRIRVLENSARVLRCADALRPDEVDTPVKQVYFAIQLLITGDLEEETTLPAIMEECTKLQHAFEPINPKLISDLIDFIEAGRFYSALNHLRRVLKLEASLLSYRKPSPDETEETEARQVA